MSTFNRLDSPTLSVGSWFKLMCEGVGGSANKETIREISTADWISRTVAVDPREAEQQRHEDCRTKRAVRCSLLTENYFHTMKEISSWWQFAIWGDGSIPRYLLPIKHSNLNQLLIRKIRAGKKTCLVLKQTRLWLYALCCTFYIFATGQKGKEKGNCPCAGLSVWNKHLHRQVLREGGQCSIRASLPDPELRLWAHTCKQSGARKKCKRPRSFHLWPWEGLAHVKTFVQYCFFLLSETLMHACKNAHTQTQRKSRIFFLIYYHLYQTIVIFITHANIPATDCESCLQLLNFFLWCYSILILFLIGHTNEKKQKTYYQERQHSPPLVHNTNCVTESGRQRRENN